MLNNRKGFTLVELLAVIVIMAILMVSAGTAVISTMNNSKINTFKNEVLTMMDGAENMYSEISMDPTNYARFVTKDYGTSPTYAAICVTLPGLVRNGYLEKNISTYAGVIILEVPFDGAPPKTMAWVHNGKYGINGIERKYINRLKFSPKNNVEKNKSASIDLGTAVKQQGGPLGIVTNLTGIKEEVIKEAYGKNDAGIVGMPEDLENGTKESGPRFSVTIYESRGGSGKQYVDIPCINNKLS